MKFEMLKFDNSHYAINLLQHDDILKWDSLGATHHLIVHADYGYSIALDEGQLAEMEKVDSSLMLSGQEIRSYVEPQRSEVYFAFLPKRLVNNYHFPISPATYSVYCCEYDPAKDVCKLYLPNDACQYRCNVWSNLEVGRKQEEVKTGILNRLIGKQEEKECFVVQIPKIPGYADGSLQYGYDGCPYKYPITKAMLGKPLRIPAFHSKPPRIESPVGGYKIQYINT